MSVDLPPELRGIIEAHEAPRMHPEYQYLNLMRKLIDKGVGQVDKGTGVKTYSLFAGQAGEFVFDLSEGFPLLTTKKVFFNGIKHELYWFLSGQSNIKYLVDHNVHIWDDYPYMIYMEKVRDAKEPNMSKEEFIERIRTDEEFVRQHGELPHIYGESWRRLPRDGREIDQVAWVLEEMTRDPDAHNLLVDSWRPEYHHGMARQGEAMRFPICHNLYQLNVQRGKVNLQLYQRTADIFLGVPFNIASYAALAHIFAHLTGNRPGEFTHVFGDVHIYEDHIPAAEEQLRREPKSFPTLHISNEATSLDTFRADHLTLGGYDPHLPIRAQLTPAGGYREE